MLAQADTRQGNNYSEKTLEKFQELLVIPTRVSFDLYTPNWLLGMPITASLFITVVRFLSVSKTNRVFINSISALWFT